MSFCQGGIRGFSFVFSRWGLLMWTRIPFFNNSYTFDEDFFKIKFVISYKIYRYWRGNPYKKWCICLNFSFGMKSIIEIHLLFKSFKMHAIGYIITINKYCKYSPSLRMKDFLIHRNPLLSCIYSTPRESVFEFWKSNGH